MYSCLLLILCVSIAGLHAQRGLSGAVLGGLWGLEHPPRSKFRFQIELTGVINSFSSAKTHCRENHGTRSYNARAHNNDHTYYVYEHAHCKSTRLRLCFLNNVPLRGGFRGPPSPRLPPFAEKFMSSLSPTFILSVHARFSMSDSFVDLPQEVVN